MTEVTAKRQDKIPFQTLIQTRPLSTTAGTFGDIVGKVIEGLKNVLPELIVGQIMHIWMFDRECFSEWSSFSLR